MTNKSALELAFEAASSKGYRTVRLNVSGLRFKLAPSTGRNPGAVYVTKQGDYIGKIQNDAFFKSAPIEQEDLITVLATMKDPKQEAIKEGHRTGSCCICGRLLTNSNSVAQGIGPICADKLGFTIEPSSYELEL